MVSTTFITKPISAPTTASSDGAHIHTQTIPFPRKNSSATARGSLPSVSTA